MLILETIWYDGQRVTINGRRIWVIKNHEITYDLQDKWKDKSLSFSPAEYTGEENFEDKILKGGENCNIPDPETLGYYEYTPR